MNENFRERTFNLVFGGVTKAAKTFDVIVVGAILASVSVVIIDSVPAANAVWHPQLRSAELAFTMLFSVEYLVRLWCHPRPARYAFSFFGLVDIISIAPTYVALFVPGWESLAVLRVLRVLRILRIFSLGRFSTASDIIARSVSAGRHKIFVVLIGVMLVAMVAGSLQYAVEGPENGFSSIPQGVYWALSTLTTLGNSELAPATPLGQFLASLVMVLGYGLIALPIGIITSEVMGARRARDEIFAGEETDMLEYKASAFFDHEESGIPPQQLFRHAVLRTVAGLMNAKGGRLVVGVRDDGAIVGIQPDLNLKNWDVDRYVNTITQKIGGELGLDAAALTTITIKASPEGSVCNIEVLPSSNPVFLKAGKRQYDFYVRVNNTTQELTGPEQANYIKRRWD
ncbi:MAG: ion transporter [Gammaproteobacteria bacterium]|nr:ion transporter [Gammaproteobacteria bacterium]